MKLTGTFLRWKRRGSALMLSLIFIAMFASLAAALAIVSGTNIQVADNFRRAGTTHDSAESGLEVMRYWLSQVVLSTAPEGRFNELETILRDQLPANLAERLTRSGSTMRITDVPLLSSKGQSFTAVLTSVDVDNIELDITGRYGSLNRKIRSAFVLAERADNVFDFGVATKAPLNLTGNVDLEDYTLEIKSNAYIDTDCEPVLSIVGHCSMGGDVNIRKSDPDLYLQGSYSIGGDSGTAALEHIHTNVPAREFPDMRPDLFYSYATDPSTGHTLSLTDSTSNATYENLYIPPNRNPSFSGTTTLKGVVYIATPNVVSFAGNLNITAIIVTNGDKNDNSGANQINFTGTVSACPITQLSGTKFAGLESQTGTFVLAPGFKATFGGDFGMVSGAIAANGLRFYGNAGGTINGSIINYNSEMPLEMTGNTDLRFNRSGREGLPAGFVPRIVMQYNPASYAEPPA